VLSSLVVHEADSDVVNLSHFSVLVGQLDASSLDC
jgi:hypothetical protein